MYFYFSPSERKGIIVLFFILIFVIFVPSIYRLIKPKNDLKISIIQFDELDSISKKKSYNYDNKNNPILFKFNPNTATNDELKQLGFTDKNIAILKNYLNKGGKIKSIDGLKKIYGINPQLINKLTPFIQLEIDNNSNSKNAFSDNSNYQKQKSHIPLELNTADSLSLVNLYLIGPTLASKIMAYRNKLGGFLNLNQLTEIYGFNEDILYDLEGKIWVDSSKAKHINLNTITEDELKSHPYFKYKMARVIVNYRNQHGNYKNINELLQIKIINDSILDRIKIYGIVE